MAKKDPNSPATTSLAYDLMLPKWEKISTLLSGTEAMREAGQLYLPQHPGETDKAYEHRKEMTFLLNMLDMTLASLVSRPFADPIKINLDQMPKELQACLQDIDLQGTSLDRYCRMWFKEGLSKGYSGTLIEFPETVPNADGSPRTAADDQREKLRPYFVHIVPENMIAARADVVNGREILTEVRIREEVIVPDGYAETLKIRIRRITPGRVQIFEKQKLSNGKIVWVPIKDYTYDLDFIPMVIFYADRQGFMLAKPPLENLADLNIRHWQSTSDQIAVLTVARFPMLAISGATETDDVKVGPNTLLSVTDPTGRYYYVEHTGKAIAVGRQDLVDLEETMAEYGATFLKKRPGGATATARALDSAEVTCALQDMTLGFQDTLNMAMWMFGQWMDIEVPEKTCEIKRNFGMSDQEEAELNTLIEARKNRDISRRVFLEGLIKFGILPEDFDFASNLTEVEKEIQDDLAREKELIQAKPKPAPSAKA